jgi:hypothetical protein
VCPFAATRDRPATVVRAGVRNPRPIQLVARVGHDHRRGGDRNARTTSPASPAFKGRPGGCSDAKTTGGRVGRPGQISVARLALRPNAVLAHTTSRHLALPLPCRSFDKLPVPSGVAATEHRRPRRHVPRFGLRLIAKWAQCRSATPKAGLTASRPRGITVKAGTWTRSLHNDRRPQDRRRNCRHAARRRPSGPSQRTKPTGCCPSTTPLAKWGRERESPRTWISVMSGWSIPKPP